MQLSSEVKLSDHVAIVKLPTKDVEDGEKAVVSGWGSTRSSSSEATFNLQKLTVNIVGYEKCRRAMPYWAKPHPSYVCTFVSRGIGACKVRKKIATL